MSRALRWLALPVSLLAIAAPAAHATTIAIKDASGLRTIDATGAPGVAITGGRDWASLV